MSLCYRNKLFVAGGIILLMVIGGFTVYKLSRPSLPALNCNETMSKVFSFHGLSVYLRDDTYEVVGSSYPGCDRNDILLWSCDGEKLNTQVWSTCNVGAKTAWNGENLSEIQDTKKLSETIGSFFVWGENRPSSVLGKDGNDRETLISSLLTGIRLLPTRTSDWSTQPQGPCAKGYHVPTQGEWEKAIELSSSPIIESLKLPGAGFLGTGSIQYNIHEGYYWSSSHARLGKSPFDTSENSSEGDNSSAYSMNFFIENGGIFTRTPTKKNTKLSVRCIMDTTE